MGVSFKLVKPTMSKPGILFHNWEFQRGVSNLVFQLREAERWWIVVIYTIFTHLLASLFVLCGVSLVFMGVLHLWKIYCAFSFSFTFANAFTWEPPGANSRLLSDTELFGILNENPFQGLRLSALLRVAHSGLRLIHLNTGWFLILNLRCFNVCCLIAPTDCLVLCQFFLFLPVFSSYFSFRTL